MTTDLGNERCVILVPVAHRIEPDCETAIRQLEERGYPVRRVYGYAAVDQARNQIATNTLDEGFEELMWIDSDIVFDPNAVERLRSHQLPMCCGIYPKKGKRSFACDFLEQTQVVSFGQQGGLMQIDRVGLGFCGYPP